MGWKPDDRIETCLQKDIGMKYEAWPTYLKFVWELE